VRNLLTEMKTTDILGIGIGIGFFGTYFGAIFESEIVVAASLAIGIFSGIVFHKLEKE
jgi:hypothetical protein